MLNYDSNVNGELLGYSPIASMKLWRGASGSWNYILKMACRPVIKENTAHVVATCQNNVLLLWRVILNCTP